MKLFKFDSDASKFEIYATYACALFLLVVIAILYGSLFGIFDNDLSRSAATASSGWHTLGAICIGLTVAFVYVVVHDSFKRPWSNMKKAAVLFILIALTAACYCGFWAGAY